MSRRQLTHEEVRPGMVIELLPNTGTGNAWHYAKLLVLRKNNRSVAVRLIGYSRPPTRYDQWRPMVGREELITVAEHVVVAGRSFGEWYRAHVGGV